MLLGILGWSESPNILHSASYKRWGRYGLEPGREPCFRDTSSSQLSSLGSQISPGVCRRRFSGRSPALRRLSEYLPGNAIRDWPLLHTTEYPYLVTLFAIVLYSIRASTWLHRSPLGTSSRSPHNRSDYLITPFAIQRHVISEYQSRRTIRHCL